MNHVSGTTCNKLKLLTVSASNEFLVGKMAAIIPSRYTRRTNIESTFFFEGKINIIQMTGNQVKQTPVVVY